MAVVVLVVATVVEVAVEVEELLEEGEEVVGINAVCFDEYCNLTPPTLSLVVDRLLSFLPGVRRKTLYST